MKRNRSDAVVKQMEVVFLLPFTHTPDAKRRVSTAVHDDFARHVERSRAQGALGGCTRG